MSNKSITNIGENTPEYVAYKLMRHIFDVEKIALGPHLVERGHGDLATRKDILGTFSECMIAVTNPVKK